MEIVNIEDIRKVAMDKDVPQTAIIEIITKCNFNCEHCYIPEHTEEMPYKDVVNIVDQLCALGVFEITLTGGEIALHKSLMDIVRYIRKKGISLVLMSNISLFSEQEIKEFSELHVHSISTSLFSIHEEINDDISRHKNSVKPVVDNAMLIKKYKIPVDIKVPVMKKNFREYQKISEFCKKNEIDLNYSVAITKRTNGDKKPIEFGLSQTELNEFIKVNDSASKKDYQNFEEKQNEYLCPAIGNNLAIDVKGNVYPCNSFPYYYGNIYSNSIYDIWNKLPERQLLKNIRMRDLEKCSNCELKGICKRCPGLAYSEGGDLYGCSEWDKKLAISRV